MVLAGNFVRPIGTTSFNICVCVCYICVMYILNIYIYALYIFISKYKVVWFLETVSNNLVNIFPF